MEVTSRSTEMCFLEKLLLRRNRNSCDIEIRIYNSKGQILYCASQKIGKEFECDVTNMSNQKVLHFNHQQNKVNSQKRKTIISSEGVLIGSITRYNKWFSLKYVISNEINETLFVIKPKSSKTYVIFASDKTTFVGTIKHTKKIFKGQFEIAQPLLLNVRMKLLILTASIVIGDDMDKWSKYN